MGEVEILKAVGQGGGLVAFVALTIIFLRFVREMHESYGAKIESAMTSLAEKFNAELSATRAAFQDQVKSLTDRTFHQQEEFQQNITGVVQEYVQIAKDNATAMTELKTVVQDLQKKNT